MNQRAKSKLARLIFQFKNAIFADGLISALYQALRYPFNRRERKRLKLLAIKRKMEVLSPLNIKDRFTKIYEVNYWDSSESRSGPGSSIDGTTNLRKDLPTLFDQFSIRTVLDAPCGDFNWMKIVTEDCNIHYIGGDIVEKLIERNIAKYSGARNRFVHLDITTNEFPKTDLWICRDCIFHLSFDDALRALQKYIESGIPYILTTTHRVVNTFNNVDIVTGDFRLIDLFSSPYYFSENVLFRIEDSTEGLKRKEMCLWSRDQMIDSVRKFCEVISRNTD